VVEETTILKEIQQNGTRELEVCRELKKEDNYGRKIELFMWIEESTC